MKATELKASIFMAIKKFFSIFDFPRTLLSRWIALQIKIVCLPFRVVPAVLRLLPWGENPDQDVQPPAEYIQPSCEDIVRQTRKLRNCAAMSISHFTGLDFFWDSNILNEKVSRFSEAYVEGDRMKIAAAKKDLDEHPVCAARPRSRQEYDRLMEEATKRTEQETAKVLTEVQKEKASEVRKCNVAAVPSGQKTELSRRLGQDEETKPKVLASYPERKVGMVNSVNKSNVTDNVEMGVSDLLKSRKRVEFILENKEQTRGNMKGQRDVQISHNRRLKHHLITTNNKLEEVLQSSEILLGEVSKLNGQFIKLESENTKFTRLENELTQGKKLIHEIEEERDGMRIKLLALEQLIKEEEEFLDDLSCESGYEEVENVCDTHDEL